LSLKVLDEVIAGDLAWTEAGQDGEEVVLVRVRRKLEKSRLSLITRVP
jgi:hypothetical protein